tara:strand:+ start:695 stop:1189 length:495 start_codon:yes stop_codon:yes gene_type:complete
MAFTYHNITGNSATVIVPLSLKKSVQGGGSITTGSGETEFLPYAPFPFGNENTYILLANVHSTDSVNVDLYITATDEKIWYDCNSQTHSPVKGSYPASPCLGNMTTVTTPTISTFYILKGVTIPVNTTLRLDKEDLLFNNDLYELVIKLSASDSAVDVIINTIN